MSDERNTNDFDEFQAWTNSTNIAPKVLLVLDRGRDLTVIESPDRDDELILRGTEFNVVEAPWIYPMLGLMGEVGEMSNKLKKVIRDDFGCMTNETREAVESETGDAFYYIGQTVEKLGSKLSVVVKNLRFKLEDRKARGVIRGSGDKR